MVCKSYSSIGEERRGGEGAAVYRLTRAMHVAVPVSCTHPRAVHSQLTVASCFLFVAVIKSSNTADSRRAYQCIKFLVQLANKCPQAKDYLLQNTSRWQWAVQWLKRKMNEHYWAPHTSSSNEYSSSRTFQRTSSAADTLAEATALLTELEAKDGEVNTSDEVDDSDNKLEGEDWEKEGMT